MANSNGQLILQAMHDIEEPATMNTIATHIAHTAGVHPNDVKEAVKATLNGGVKYGFIQRLRQKYFAKPAELNEVDSEPELDKDDSNENGELEDRAARRRRSPASKRSRNRSRSRSSRGRSRRGGSRRRRR